MESQRITQKNGGDLQTRPTVTIDDILITDELNRRLARQPDYAAENCALVSLAQYMTQNPKQLLHHLTDIAVELCKAGSAGISLIEQDADGEFFSWVALSGVYAPYVGGRTPRHFSPCGTTLERKAPQLFYAPARLFVYLNVASTPIVEGLVVPFDLNGRAAGTIWIVGHDEQQHFDAEDVRVMTSLARFTGAAIQMIQTLDAEATLNLALQTKINEHKQVVEALRQSETALLELNGTLEQRVQERTDDLERSNRELDQFAYVASHDLKAPLRAINQLASWVIEDSGSLLPTVSQEHLHKLQGRVKRLEVLLDDLLSYSRAGRHRHPIEEVDTTELIANVLDQLAVPPNFTIHIAKQMPGLVTERIPLETVFRNLISNAIKHHFQPATTGHVEISAEDTGEFVTFSVKDDGPGIDEAYHQRIFEMFHTLRPRDQVEGSGIGLSVVKKIVESRDGTIEVNSSVGNGSIFRFTWLKTPSA